MCWSRLHHPEVNSRRPGRFEVRASERAERRVQSSRKHPFPRRFRYVGRSMQMVCLCSFALLSLSLSGALLVSLRPRFSASHAKVALKKKSICSAEMKKGDFFWYVAEEEEEKKLRLFTPRQY